MSLFGFAHSNLVFSYLDSRTVLFKSLISAEQGSRNLEKNQ